MSNLFIPPKFVNGSLIGINGNAFALMAHFKKLARSQKWTSVEIDFVISKCMESTYDELLQTLISHMNEIDE